MVVANTSRACEFTKRIQDCCNITKCSAADRGRRRGDVFLELELKLLNNIVSVHTLYTRWYMKKKKNENIIRFPSSPPPPGRAEHCVGTLRALRNFLK